MSKRKANGGLSNFRKKPNIFSLQSFGHTLRDSATPPTARAGNLSADGRRADVQFVPLRQESHRGESSDQPANQDNEDDWQDLPGETTGFDDNLRYWVENFRDAYLRVLVTRERAPWSRRACALWAGAGEVSLHGVPWRRDAVSRVHVKEHRMRPLCQIEAWGGKFFERRELRQLGLRVQLGHPDNVPCPRVQQGREKFVVIAPNGFHHVAVDFCGCQLKRFPASLGATALVRMVPRDAGRPKSAITIPALKLFHAVSLQGKTTVYHFFNALAKITDNTGSKAFKHRYKLALRAVREWRNLRALKRGGMGNDPDRRASETQDGELAVECIACPKVGVNLPEGWDKAAGEEIPVRALLGLDACFRLKGKKSRAGPQTRAFRRMGPPGIVLVVLWLTDRCYADEHMYGLAALDHANTKYSQGYRATGCAMVTCGRHEVVAKNGVGDLQAGEKYGNMDYVVASAWRHLPPALRFHIVQYVVKYVIPKLHILGHLKFCQDFFSLLYTLGAAQADMEGIERIWSSSGLMGASTREMGPGSRQDTLDDFWHHWNWGKVVGMGLTLRKRFLKAQKELTRQQDGLLEFIAEQRDNVAAWKKAVEDFETGESLVNPYELPQSGPSLRDIELELVREEQERERSSEGAADAGEDTMTGYLMLGLEIEGQQRQLSADLLANRSPTTKELTDFVTRRTRIARQVKKLRSMQRKYSPGALQHLAIAGDSLPPLSAPELAASEARLRDAQCSGSLDLIRHGLSVKKRLQTYKQLNARRQHQNTRSRSLLDMQQRKVDVAAATYRNARKARLALAHVTGNASWRALEKADLRLLEDEEEAKRKKQRAMKGKRKEAAQVNEEGEIRGVPGMGEKERLISWIWQGAGYTGGVIGESLHEGVRVEWSKAYTRVRRWREELLLQEEMARCLRTLEWQGGTMAFAARQAALRRKLANRFRRQWWELTDAFQGPQAADSSESSGGEEPDAGSGLGNDDSDDDEGDSEVEPAAPAADGEREEGKAEEGDELAARRVEMNALLAIQSTSLSQYDEV
ncbi:hypothetical protein B0H14DRAFT_3527423 [Mycena olivaceomarginata]|nr:hypothetical protein B0H14DRAFT_3527423 [Mycena olivaceomarginata]